jgi:hypothetical protein
MKVVDIARGSFEFSNKICHLKWETEEGRTFYQGDDYSIYELVGSTLHRIQDEEFIAELDVAGVAYHKANGKL